MDEPSASSLPSGTVTFLFTDMEGSTESWDHSPANMRKALERHDRIVCRAIEAHGGRIFATGGDAYSAVFARVGEAVAAAVEAQRALTAEDWPADAPVRVRMGMHTGEAFERDGNYFGPAVNRAARVMSVAHGGQIVCSEATEVLALPLLPEGCSLQRLGTVKLKGLNVPETVFGILGSGLESRFPPPRTIDALPGNLPAPTIHLIGRGDDVERLTALVLANNLVTVTGPPGVGKTSLVVDAANVLVDKFADGVWFVELGSARSAVEVGSLVASSLRVREQPGQPVTDSLTTALSSQRMLVVMDNCEHVLGSVAELVDAFRRGCSTVVIVATSRERLALPGEHEYVLAPLSADGEHSPAVELFFDRAGPNLSSLAAEQDAVIEICSRLDGLPFAIELAATRCRAMLPSALVLRLQTGSGFLVDRRSIDPRRSTVANMVRWSYDLLPPTEQRLFARLGVFFGGFDLEAAEAVAGLGDIGAIEVDDVLVSLVGKSLVVHDLGWYRLLETTREFALAELEALGEAEIATRAHIDWYVRFAAAARTGLRTVDEMTWVDRLDREWPNVRAAFASALQLHDLSQASAIATELWEERVFRRADAVGWAGVVLDHIRQSNLSPVAKLWATAAMEATQQGDVSVAQELTEAALLADSNSIMARMAGAFTSIGTAQAVQHALAMMDLAEATHDPFDRGAAALTGALVGSLGGIPIDGAARLADSVLHGPPVSLTTASGCELALALDAMMAGRADDVADHARRSMANAQDARNPYMFINAQSVLALSAQVTLDEAVETASYLARAGIVVHFWTWVLLAAVALLDSEAELAARLAGAVPPGLVTAMPALEIVHANLAGRLDDETITRNLAEGERLTVADVLAVLHAVTPPGTPDR